jgi:Fe-S-cluster containining protein
MNRKDRRREAKLGQGPSAPQPPARATGGGFGAGDAFAFLYGQRPTVASPPPPPAPAKSPFRDVSIAVQNRTLDALRAGRNPAALAQAVGEGAAKADQRWDELRPAIEARKQPGFACAAGCAWCCHQQVAVEPVEAIAIARHIETKFTPEARAALKQRVDALANRTEGMGNLAWARLKTACAFLSDGKCSIYEVRPLRCRAVFSRDAEHCRWAMDNPDLYFGARERRTGPGPYPVEPRQIVDAALAGFAVAERDFGLHWKTLTLMAAIRILLDRPDAAERYLAGEAVFTPALLPEDDDSLPAGSPAPGSSSAGLAKPGDSA